MGYVSGIVHFRSLFSDLVIYVKLYISFMFILYSLVIVFVFFFFIFFFFLRI
eukprot:NODE_11711_length_189_cov_74.335714_g10551_i0.p1 GENE.NODE_11711_length_189_cov_74.335714_g10551_i0~~NODE_11711_length_189_cov_74.335714_g10551_i0.p1  ORF type:complete len:52 (+),score=2.64 NODE_11711_length_189_cov_74.335714_g10551_i0:32-187(+)